ncbi:hypothetical protein [uncultured Caulobacter sp.]|uniref:hypothetical protein n=1 Tax=uncultured Caulobacter sp. TaxID=158749 RepID=UPI00262B08A4|nr:hypothetical protein [uncultured Caulobacter sp.]
MSNGLTPYIGPIIVFGAFIVLVLLGRGWSERRVRAHFAREGTVLRVKRVGQFSAFADRRRMQEFRVRVRRPDGVEVTYAAELEGLGPVRRLW